jgi:hypothetical protein
MTSTASSGDHSRASQVSAACAHSLIYVLVAGVVTRVASYCHVLVGFDQIVTVVWVVCAVTATVHRRAGDLCIRCMREVPADAPVRAGRQKWLLRFSHFTDTWPAAMI